MYKRQIYGVTGLPPIAFAWDVVYNIVNGTTVVDTTEQDIKIQSNKGLAGWFNLDGGNSVPSVRIAAPLIAEPAGITTGSQLYMVPGTKATLTDLMTAGETIIVPVVQNDFDQKSYYPRLCRSLAHGGQKLVLRTSLTEFNRFKRSSSRSQFFSSRA